MMAGEAFSMSKPNVHLVAGFTLQKVSLPLQTSYLIYKTTARHIDAEAYGELLR